MPTLTMLAALLGQPAPGGTALPPAPGAAIPNLSLVDVFTGGGFSGRRPDETFAAARGEVLLNGQQIGSIELQARDALQIKWSDKRQAPTPLGLRLYGIL